MKRKTEKGREDLLLRISHWLDVPMALLAVIWAILIVLDLTMLLPAGWAERVRDLDILIWFIFLAEFLFELALASNKLQYLYSHWYVALSVVIPFLRVIVFIRALRGLRGLSLLSIVLRANRAASAAKELFARRRFQYVAVVDAIVALVGGAAVFYFERDAQGAEITSLADALWWAATMVTTINTSTDPVTWEGRIIAFLIRLIGLATFGYITASIATFLIGREEAGTKTLQREEEEKLTQLGNEIAAMQEALEELRRREVKRD